MDFTDTFTFAALGDSVTYLRMAQRRQIDGYPVYAWTSPIWVTVA